MPQFDIFSFLSQLFWVFLAFLLFYLLICFYLLPALASILKTRKRKLANISSNLNSTLVVNTDFATFTKVSLDNINLKVNSLLDVNSGVNSTFGINQSLSIFLLKSESLRIFNTNIFSQAQIAYILYV